MQHGPKKSWQVGDLVCECEVEQLIDTEGPGTTIMLIESHERGFVAKVPLIAERPLLSIQHDVPHQMICGAEHTKPSCSSPRATPCPWTTASPSSPKTRPPSPPSPPTPRPARAPTAAPARAACSAGRPTSRPSRVPFDGRSESGRGGPPRRGGRPARRWRRPHEPSHIHTHRPQLDAVACRPRSADSEGVRPPQIAGGPRDRARLPSGRAGSSPLPSLPSSRPA